MEIHWHNVDLLNVWHENNGSTPSCTLEIFLNFLSPWLEISIGAKFHLRNTMTQKSTLYAIVVIFK
jgi:hypothetical protein